MPRLSNSDDAGELGKTPQEPGKAGLGPEAFEMGDPPHDEHEVDRTIAEHLVGDVDVAAARIPRDRDVRYRRLHRGRCARGARGSRQFRFQRADRHGGDEAIPAPVRRLDVLRLARIVVQRLPDFPDADLERGVADEDVGPQRVEELLLGDEATGVLREIGEYVVGLGGERNDTVVALEPAAGAIEHARAEDQRAAIGRRQSVCCRHAERMDSCVAGVLRKR